MEQTGTYKTVIKTEGFPLYMKQKLVPAQDMVFYYHPSDAVELLMNRYGHSKEQAKRIAEEEYNLLVSTSFTEITEKRGLLFSALREDPNSKAILTSIIVPALAVYRDEKNRFVLMTPLGHIVLLTSEVSR